ncbi:conserved hypothetical protein [uncultured Desulfobacterium sp.]|uniref:Uncharacterized protein n=1 Tax=uncultured Desulfobacterium sp. TaxID=201089 RepID=A0A445MQV0_9BACT|nr:conserved hypothetical protein [uncultured Desulfobacterium sp.]
MSDFLDSRHFPSASAPEDSKLAESLERILNEELKGSFLNLFSGYKNILGDNSRKKEWFSIHEKLAVIFKCGKCVPLDGPMIGVTIAIRDSDYFKKTAQMFGADRSSAANLEWMARLWNITFANTGLWMGKTFEPVSMNTVAEKIENNPEVLKLYDENISRIGRNFFRTPHNPNLLQLAGLPILKKSWSLKERPRTVTVKGFDGTLLYKNINKERSIPYEETGGLFIANNGISVVPEMNGKKVYQLNYRWPVLGPVYPLTLLVDELVQVDAGIYLGQLVMATKHYSTGTLKISVMGKTAEHQLGEVYTHDSQQDYGYQNNGFFLMIDTDHAKMAYADDAFPELRPHPGETGFSELGYDATSTFFKTGVMNSSADNADPFAINDWANGWRKDKGLYQKFTTFVTEASTRKEDPDIRRMLNDGESILQMIKRIKDEIDQTTKHDDRLKLFDNLNQIFRAGVAPRVQNGLFRGSGKRGYNTCLNGLPEREWYGAKEPLIGFDHYHGCTLNLHWGFGDTFREKVGSVKFIV